MSTEVVLVLNAGSSSLKFSLFAMAADGRPEASPLYRGLLDGLGSEPRFTVEDARGNRVVDERLAGAGGGTGHDAALAALLRWLDRHAAALETRVAGHRIVHGGATFTAPVLATDAVVEALAALTPLAPLHQPHGVAAIRALAAQAPGLPQVACFDTAFHATMPPVARTFALPRALSAAGVRRYGFHGLSYEHIAEVLPQVVGAVADGRVVVAHLGHGASMCAMVGRRSVATTMGLTALDGLPMGTRSGALDPGVVLYLMRERGLGHDDLSRLLYEESGLRGVSGLSGDMRELLASPAPEAAEAIDLFVYWIGRELGSLAAALGGLDAVVFTAGIGERAAPIRARVCEGAGWLGLRLDPAANAAGGPRISAPDSRVSAWVVPTDEELVIARHAARLLRHRG